ncbi:hypothetical protein [Enterococcus mundtii]|uniref:Uncharacterized protein n=1 Tax=Enterococcus mundtii TaxID=53346 RepID=A0A1V2UEX1_ENTMU|nr:hypothetical protein [Enterococcus mundtii]ONN41860.1 hypothetical protein BTN92_11930 [Enterococcus mundtii]
MKKIYQKCLWISYITLGIAAFFVSLAVIVVTIFLWFINEDLSFNWFMSLLSFTMFLFLCLEIRKFMPSHYQEKKKEFREEIEIRSNDWIENTWLPLKRNIKRKEFWMLQLWPLGKICSYVARLIFDLTIYSIGVFGTAYFLINDPDITAASDIFTVLMTLIFVMFLSLFTQLIMQFTKQDLSLEKLFKNLFDLFVISGILVTITKRIEQSGRTTKGIKELLMTFVHFVNGHMYLFEIGIILALIGYISTKLIKRSIENELDIDLIPTISGYEYYVHYGKYDELIRTDIVHTSIHETIVRSIRSILKDGQDMKNIVRKKEVYNFYEVEANLRYGIGKLWLGGNGNPQNKHPMNSVRISFLKEHKET